MEAKFRRSDRGLAILFGGLSVVFLLTAMYSPAFMEWVFARHHNQWSWYIRPFFIIPFCYFAFKRSWSGISGTILLLLTSMFWFSRPSVENEAVNQFLQYEMDWLTGEWDVTKMILILLVPLSLSILAAAFWFRSVWIGISVVICMAVGKIVWSVTSAGESGASVIVPALVGLLLCTVVIFWGFKRMKKL